MQQTLTGPSGEATRTLMVDAVEVNIQIDGEFAGRVLQDLMADNLNAVFAAAGWTPRSIACTERYGFFAAGQRTADRQFFDEFLWLVSAKLRR
jgi:hypothetical protein